jgi:hypothetical protein
VLRSHREPLHVPGPNEDLFRESLGKSTTLADCFHHSRKLGNGRDVDGENAARLENMLDGADALPRRQHVQDNPVHALCAKGKSNILKISDLAAPLCGGFANVGHDIGPGDIGKFFSAFNGGHASAFSDSPKKRQCKSPRSHTGFEDMMTWSNIGKGHYLGRVFGINDGGTTGHGHHKITEKWP